MNLIGVGTLPLAAALVLTSFAPVPAAAVPASASPSTLVVDRDGLQCGNAEFTSIQAAVDAAAPGDVIRVCPDLYPEDVTVDKPLTLVGDPDAVEAVDCFSPLAAQPGDADPSRYPIVDPAGDGFSVTVALRADDVVLSGFVIQGASVGIDASDLFSGYRIHHNLIRLNTLFGVDLGSEGTRESQVDHNCIRENRWGLVSELDDDSLWSFPVVGDERGQWNARDLRNARIDHNSTFRNNAGVEAAGPGRHDQVTFDHNTSIADRDAILIQNSTNSTIVGNEVMPVRFGVLMGGANVGLQIVDNRVGTGLQGIVFAPATFFIDPFPPPTVGAVVASNTVTGLTLDGIVAAADRLKQSVLVNNVVSGNGRDGIVLRVTTIEADNVLRDNAAERNARYGIYSQGAKGNYFLANQMLGNAVLDARDEARETNTWIANQCATDFPTGTICGVG